jgi:hypothetical protein
MRSPDQIIGTKDKPHCLRWFLIPRNPIFNVCLHKFVASDTRPLHDHKYWSMSIILRGQYLDRRMLKIKVRTPPKGQLGGIAYTLTTDRVVMRETGSISLNPAKRAHRVELLAGDECWSLFLTGPRFREWGFYCKDGWKKWTDFKLDNPGDVEC